MECGLIYSSSLAFTEKKIMMRHYLQFEFRANREKSNVAYLLHIGAILRIKKQTKSVTGAQQKQTKSIPRANWNYKQYLLQKAHQNTNTTDGKVIRNTKWKYKQNRSQNTDKLDSKSA